MEIRVFMEGHKRGKGIYLFIERYTAFCQEVGLGERGRERVRERKH